MARPSHKLFPSLLSSLRCDPLRPLMSLTLLAIFCVAPAPSAFAANIAKLARECSQNKARACEELSSIASDPKMKSSDRLEAIRILRDEPALTAIAQSSSGDDVSKAAKKRLQDLLNLHFMHAAETGNITSLKALAAKGAKADYDTNALVIEDFQNVNGGFRYRLVCQPGASAFPPLLSAISAGRSDLVRALIDLGLPVKGEFVTADAMIAGDAPIPIYPQMIENAVCLGLSFSVLPAYSIASDGTVVSRVAPTPEKKASYLRYAQDALAAASDDKSKANLTEIVAILQTAEAGHP